MRGQPVDLALVTDGWNSNVGKWAPDTKALEARARETRQWLKARPEKEVVLVTHGGFLHYLTEDWTDADKLFGTCLLLRQRDERDEEVVTNWILLTGGFAVAGTGWENAEFRSYQFTDDPSTNAALEETAESRDRRRGTEKPLDETERTELERTVGKPWEDEGYEISSKA